jgi:hypothetical protein
MTTLTKMYVLAISLALTSCEFSCNMGDKKANKENTVKSGSDKENAALSGTVIKNDIDVEATGVKVKEVYLADANGMPLEKNEAKLNEKIYAVIKLDTGWAKVNGKSFVGAGERILTSEGTVVVDAEDIFKDNEAEGFSPKDASVISLSAVITRKAEGIDNYAVQFKAWDKKGKGEVKGKYKFKIVE